MFFPAFLPLSFSPFLCHSLSLPPTLYLPFSLPLYPSISLSLFPSFSLFPSLSVFLATHSLKPLCLSSQGTATLCINLFNYAFIYAAVALCKCILWLNKLFPCFTGVCSLSVCWWHHTVSARNLMALMCVCGWVGVGGWVCVCGCVRVGVCVCVPMPVCVCVSRCDTL